MCAISLAGTEGLSYVWENEREGGGGEEEFLNKAGVEWWGNWTTAQKVEGRMRGWLGWKERSLERLQALGQVL